MSVAAVTKRDKDDDDFVDNEGQRDKKRGFSVPPLSRGQLAAARRWQGGDLARTLGDKFAVKFLDLKVADFCTEHTQLVLYLPEADYVGFGGQKGPWRSRLANFYGQARPLSSLGAVVVQRTPTAAQAFLDVQEFAVIELGLPVIPVTGQNQLPQLLIELIGVKKRPNPFCFGSKAFEAPSPEEADATLVKVLSSLPGVGDLTARQLLSKFGSLKAIFEASEDELSTAVGPAQAKSLRGHFTP